jgi:hypothetical protein
LKKNNNMNTDKVTRVEVIDHQDEPKGRIFTKNDCEDVEIQLQDDGRTLKIFILSKAKQS